MRSSPSPRGRGGIQVRTVQRRAQPSSPASSSSAGGRRRASRPSARFRKAVGHGGDFVKDEEAGRQFENRVLEVYAPAETVNETKRQVPLGAVANLEGSNFQLPKLSDMCLEVLSDHFDTHILPLQFAQNANTDRTRLANKSQSARRNRNAKRGILGIPVAGYDEDADGDFMPHSDDEDEDGRRGNGKRKGDAFDFKSVRRKLNNVVSQSDEDFFVQERNASDLDVLPPKLTVALQRLLERKRPKLLTREVLARYFLSEPKVKDSRTFRILAIIGGVPADDVVFLYRSLLSPSSAQPQQGRHAAPAILRPNAVTSLSTLHLQAFTRLTSRQLQPLFSEAVHLENVNLRGCVNVTSEAIERLVQTCGPSLQRVNMNWTSIGLSGVECLIRGAPNLTELKVAHVRGLNDASVPAMMNRVTQETVVNGTVPLARLERLKLHGTQVGVASVGSLLKHCGPNMRMLDLGATHFGGPGCIEMLFMALGLDTTLTEREKVPSLQKINLSRLEVPESELMLFISAVKHLKQLRRINLNHVHSMKGGSASGLGNVLLAMLFESVAARAREEWIERASEEGGYTFERISIAAGSATTRPLMPGVFQIPSILSDHEQDVASSPKIVRSLDLSGLDLSKQHQEPYSALAKLPDGTPKLLLEFHAEQVGSTLNVEHVQLSGCRLPEALPWNRVGIDGRLRSIDLSGTAAGRESIDTLIRSNPCLDTMDLTGCRSIPVRLRRSYLNVSDEDGNGA